MRKLLAIAASAATATVALGALSVTTASAQCPGNDGTAPGFPARNYAVGPFYVDDRDFLDLNDNDDAGGLWVYQESGKKGNLQRGGDQVVFTMMAQRGIAPNVPRVNPIKTGLPHPTRPGDELILFPSGIGGGSLAETTGFHDDCKQDVVANRDVILF